MTARRLGGLLAVLAGFTILTALFFWPVLPHLSSVLLGPPEDNLNDFWNSWYVAQGHEHSFFLTRLIRAPEGVSLYYQSFAYPQVFAVWILTRIFGTSVPTLVSWQNLTILASFPLAGTAAFYLCRHLGGGRIGAAAGGFIFAFNPWHIAQAMHHAHVASIEFLPGFALCYLLALERRHYGWLAGAVFFYALSALSCWYYLFYCFYFLIFHLFYLRVHEHRWPCDWRLGASILCVAGTIVLLSPLMLPMALSGLHGNAYHPGGGIFSADIGGNIFTADLLSYFAFPPTHILQAWGAGLYADFTGNSWEGGVYLGLANLGLLAWGFWKTKHGQRRHLWYALGGMLFFAALASGDKLHWQGVSLPLYMPNSVLSQLPFFANVRTPARAIVFVYLFLGIAVAMAIATMRKIEPMLLTGTALALMLLDFFPAHLETTAMACSTDLSVLARDKDRDFAVLDLPFGYNEANFYMAQQACHGRPIAQGIVARQLLPTLADHLNVTNFAVQRRQLETARIKYIVLHRPENGMFDWDTQRNGDLESYRRTYAVATDGPDVTVLRVY